ncbi:MAG: biotin transporter BioY [Dehalococcoidia bacterium]|nr:biotin transporter BioY [Dehalococcoidia bacterium]
MQRNNTALTLSEAIFPRTGALNNAFVRDLILIIGFSWFVALCAQIKIPLTPVPITGQTLGVLVAGAVLGSWRGGLSLIAYTLQGGFGLPFFAGGAAGFAVIAGPTGGYIVGFVFAAFMIGLLAEGGWDRSFITMAFALLLGNVIIYVFGLGGLARFVPGEKLLALGLLPFIPGDIVKLILATLVIPGAWKLTYRNKQH